MSKQMITVFLALQFGCVSSLPAKQELQPLKLTGNLIEAEDKILEPLLGLEVLDGRLKLRKNWSTTMPEPRKHERRLGGRFNERRLGGRFIHQNASPFGIESSKLIDKVKCNRRGTSTQGDEQEFHGVNRAVKLSLANSDEGYNFSVRQLRGDENRLELEVRTDGSLAFLFLFEDGLFRLTQNAKRVRLVVIQNENLGSWSAENFSQLYRQNPEPIDQILMPLMDYLGMERILTMNSAEVRNYAKPALQVLSDGPDEELSKMVKQLGAPSYVERTIATETIRENFDRWQQQLLSMKNDESLSTEALARIELVLESEQLDTPRRQFIADYIESEKLFQDQAFMFSLVDDPKMLELVVAKLSAGDDDSDAEAIRAAYRQWKSKLDKSD